MPNHNKFGEKLLDQGRLKKKIFLILIFAFLISILWGIYTQMQVFPLHDFVEYWASGRINLSGGNPYSADQMLALEQSVGWKINDALMMLNPPWTLLYAMIFGLFSYPISRFLCFLIQLSIVTLCAILLWKIYNGNKRREWIAWLALLSFGPILHALRSGQVTILVLLGSIGFLYFVNRKSDFWAGIFAGLVFYKPHLLYLFIMAVIIWSISRHRYRILLGILSTLVVSVVLVYLFNPQIIGQYIDMVRFYPIENWMTSTLGAYLRVLIDPGSFYIQLIPSLIGIAWLLIYWFRHDKSFEWKTSLPLISLVSIVTNPYGWTLDVTVCVLCVICITSLLEISPWTIGKTLIFITYWGANLSITFLSGSQNWFWWFPSFLLVWYLVSISYIKKFQTALIKNDLAEAL